jgi:putative ABC transport system permease protein
MSITMLRVALRAIFADRLRALLTVLGIVVGVGSVITLIAYSAGVERELLSRFDRRGATTLGVGIAWWHDDIPSSEVISPEDAQAVRDECWTIEHVALIDQGELTRVTYSVREAQDCDLVATEVEYFDARPTEFSQGRPFTKEEDNALERVCVLGGKVYYDLFFNEPAAGKYVNLDGKRFQVVGVLVEQGGRRWENTDQQVIVPINSAKEHFDTFFYGAELLMKVREFEHMPYAETQVRELIYLRHPHLPVPEEEEENLAPWEFNESESVWAWSVHDWREQRRQAAESLGKFLIVMGALALLIGGVGVMNIMLVSVEERTAEIGLRIALGATPTGILGQFLSEAVLVCLAGGAVGTLLAVAACRYMERLPDELQVPDPIMTSAAITIAVVVTFGIGIAAGVYPAWRAANLNPIEALHHE